MRSQQLNEHVDRSGRVTNGMNRVWRLAAHEASVSK
jgi:hypothetical protein